ncbi:hypothetical protein OsJ_02198 [Oryza sativa Japonica Group]|uniref:Uncharacterized protein n=1 Tax=Oryza sativa subsp. japonica TaxID=39947 RepID=B9EXI2_ORYSJ|nr:hypothetical protein OsJ_02198 [Oryza sativa Japonica Group]
MSSARSVVSPSAAQVGGGSSARDVEQQKSAAAVGASSPVMVQYGFTEIPKKCILKRWTKDARDSIPKHLEESYLKDKEAASSRTYRNTLLHKSALDMVRLGGTSSETYEKTVEVLTKLIGELQVMCTSQVVNNKEIHCGDRTIGKKPTSVQLDDSVDSSDSEHGMSDDFCVADEDGIGHDVSAGEDSVDVDITDVNEEDILPPEACTDLDHGMVCSLSSEES